MNWTYGYAADTEYTSQYFAEMTPAHLDLMALTAQVLPPEHDAGRYRYCELGCGNGMSTALLAAANPQAEFVGIDFMPVHIANARRAARRGGLKNVQFLEMSFAQACDHEFEPFDYIVAHGVYSWISPANRLEMVQFFKKFLAPGGLVYLSYNTHPGWTPVSPVQKLVSEIAGSIQGSSPKRVVAGFDFASKLLSKGALAFASHPAAKQQIEKAATQQPNYLAQEFINADWHPMYVTDVMRELDQAKLEFASSATAADNDYRFIVDEEMAKVIREQPTVQLRELVKDIATNCRFRRDIYTRGGRRLSGLDQRQLLARKRIALVRSPSHINYHCDLGGRKLNFETPMARETVNALAKGPKTLAEIAQHLSASGSTDGLRAAIEVTTVLIVAGCAIPVEENARTPTAMNKSLTAAALEDTACNALCTSWGTGIIVNLLEMALIEVAAPRDTVAAVAEKLFLLAQRKGRVFNNAGVVLNEEAAAKEYLLKEVSEASISRLPILAQLGIGPGKLS